MPQFSHLRWCIVVANGARARFFSLHPTARQHPPTEVVLQEQGDLLNLAGRHLAVPPDGSGLDIRRIASGGAPRNDDASVVNWKREQDRRFATQVMEKTADFARAQQASTVVIVAESRMLGLLRAKRDRLQGVQVLELTRDLSRLGVPAIYAHLRSAGLVPGLHATLRQRPHAPQTAAGRGAHLDRPANQSPSGGYGGATA